MGEGLWVRAARNGSDVWRFALALVLLSLVLACATRAPAPPRYWNETLGIATDFSSDWTIVTDRARTSTCCSTMYARCRCHFSGLGSLPLSSAAIAVCTMKWVRPDCCHARYTGIIASASDDCRTLVMLFAHEF